MNRTKTITDHMTAQHWEALGRIERQLAARRLMGHEFVQATAPWDRPENESRRVSLPRRAA